MVHSCQPVSRENFPYVDMSYEVTLIGIYFIMSSRRVPSNCQIQTCNEILYSMMHSHGTEAQEGRRLGGSSRPRCPWFAWPHQGQRSTACYDHQSQMIDGLTLIDSLRRLDHDQVCLLSSLCLTDHREYFKTA
jgi:hypothetical protein